MHASMSNPEPRARRIGVVLSILFLASLGTVATVSGARAGGQQQADAPIAPSVPYVTAL